MSESISESEVLHFGKRLSSMIQNKSVDSAEAVDILKFLQKSKITLDILHKTRIGMIVNNFRKSSNNEETVILAKTLIKSWKKLLPESSNSSKRTNNDAAAADISARSTDSPGPFNINSSDQLIGNSSESKNERGSPLLNNNILSPEANSLDNSTTTSSYVAHPSTTDNPVRLKCREMLSKALQTEPIPSVFKESDFLELGSFLEDAIFKVFNNLELKYRNRVRSRISNLKDPRNPELRYNFLAGHISADRLAQMTAEEMASSKMRKMREEMTKESIKDHQMALTGGTQTSLLKCGKCGKRNCTYNQVQTRSADEPMTTFCFCNECGNRWKFC